jgi:hypothetical protein
LELLSKESDNLESDSPESDDLEEVDSHGSHRGDDNTSNHTSSVTKQASRMIVKIPFLTWNPRRTDGLREHKGSATDTTVMLRLLDNVNEILCSNDEKIGKMYFGSFECTGQELLQRHPFLTHETSQTQAQWQGAVTLISISRQLFETSQAILSQFLPDSLLDQVGLRRLWGFVDDIICVSLVAPEIELEETLLTPP